jgi:glycosyltransferase involved in cell wall biosynthesis
MVTPYFPPEGGGLERYATTIASRLAADHGWRVVFVTSGTRGSSAAVTMEEGFKVYRLPAQVILSRTPLALSWPRRVAAIARKEQATLINAHAPVPGLADAAAMTKGRRPFVLTYHAGPMHKGKVVADGAIKIYEKTLLRYTALRSNMVICNSNFVQDAFARDFSGKSVVVPPGVDASEFRPGDRKRRGAILFVAHLDTGMEFKGLGTLLEAVGALVADGTDVTLEVVGSGQLLPSYRSKAAALGLGPDRVRFSGRLSGLELKDAYHRSSVAALPSGNESFGMFLAEAMACGLPVVASRTGGIPDVVRDGETGLLVTHGDVTELSNALRRVVEDPSLAARMGTAGRRRAESEFAWEARARATHDAFVTTLDRTTPIPRVRSSRVASTTESGAVRGAPIGRDTPHSRREAERWRRGSRGGTVPTRVLPEESGGIQHWEIGVPPSRPLRVTQVTSRYPPDLGGMERAVKELSEALAVELGGPVEVITGFHGGTSTVQEGRVLVRRLRSFDVEVTPVAPRLVWALARSPRPDWFHVHVAHAGTGEAVALVARLRRVPFIAHVHIDAEPTTWMGFLLGGYQKVILARVLAGASLVLVPTDSYRPLLIEKYRLDPNRVRVLPYGTLMETRVAGHPVQAPGGTRIRLLTVGRMAREKNLPLLIDTVGALVDGDHLDVELEVVGDGPVREELARHITDHGLGSRVHLVGRRDGSALVESYDGCDIFAMTSLVDSFGIVLIEAMARGVPVIAPDIVGVRDVVIDGVNGLLVEHTVESVRAAVLRVLFEPGLREHLIAGALTHASRYQWPEIARQYLRLCREARVIPGEVSPS